MPTKSQLLAQLQHFATLLELDGANTFKVGAYTKAIRALAAEDPDLDMHVRTGSLTTIEGVGTGIAEKITEFWNTGRIEEHDVLAAKYPPGVIEMTTIPGFGAKKTRAVYDQLSVASIGELENACRNGRVADLKGFGKKTAEKILQGIEQLRRHQGRFRIDTAYNAAMPILEALRALPAAERVEVGGSLRRWRETAKDIDFICATNDADAVMDFFVEMDEVDQVIGKGGTKASVLLESGIQADLRCVTPEEFPFTLQHFTGSKEHNTVLRARARAMGMKSNEYGLYRESEEESLPAETEEDIYRWLGLQYIPPELREDMGEITVAEKDELPVLVEANDLRGLPHMHTTYSDGRPSLEDYARWAHANGMEWMGIADHSQTAAYAGGMKPDRVRVQWAEINRINKEWRDRGVRLLRGVESDILGNGRLDYEDDLLEQFEFIVASIHSQFNLSEEVQTERMIRAVENPYTTILGHMTGRLLLKREGYSVRQKDVINRCAALGVIIEINANPLRLDLDWRLVHYALDQGCYLCLSPDAHDLKMLEDTRYGLGIARKGWVSKDRLANCWTAEEFIAFARKRRG